MFVSILENYVETCPVKRTRTNPSRLRHGSLPTSAAPPTGTAVAQRMKPTRSAKVLAHTAAAAEYVAPVLLMKLSATRCFFLQIC